MNEKHPSQEELFVFSEGLLAADQSRSINTHTQSCPACMAVINDFKIIQNSIKIPDDHEPPELLVARLKKHAREINKPKPAQGYTITTMFDFIRAHSIAVSSAVAACFVFGIFGISEYRDFLMNHSQTPNKALLANPVDMPVNMAKNSRDTSNSSNISAVMNANSETAETLETEGRLAYESGNFSKAIELLNKAIALKPSGTLLEDALYYKALSHLAVGEKEKAVVALEELKQANPHNINLESLEKKISL